MAEIQNTANNTQKRKGIRCKKLSTRIDLTPMVDLGFLLITFFIFTTTMSQANAMKVIVPADNDSISKTPKTPAEKTISLLLGGNDKVFYYHGTAIDQLNETDYSSNGLRQVLMQKQKNVAAAFPLKPGITVLIKPLTSSSYKNIVDVLDEMNINLIKTYVLQEPDKIEKALSIK